MKTSAGTIGGRGRRSRCAFTLLEVIVVLALLSVLSAFVAAGFSNTRAALSAESQILRAHLRFVQTMAMANNTCTWGLSFTGSGYGLLRDGQPALINLPGENAPHHRFADNVNLVQGGGTYTFCQWGCPGATLHITLSDGRHTETITILALTGLVQ